MPEALIQPVKLPTLLGVPHALPYQGSKKKLAHAIVPLLPAEMATLVEPFAGSAAVTVAAMYAGKVSSAHIRDFNGPLMGLWGLILEDPEDLADRYEATWLEGKEDAAGTYSKVRDRFNRDHDPADLLYLLARCVKAAVRYNAKGEFNQGADKRRLGAKPREMRTRVTETSAVLAGKTQTSTGDFRELLHDASREDVVYMDPPYQGTSGPRDGRYLAGLGFDDFLTELRRAVKTETSFLISYDGSTGGRTYGSDLPDELDLLHLHLKAGTSSQSTLDGTFEETLESLYVSPALVERLGGVEAALTMLCPEGPEQLSM